MNVRLPLHVVHIDGFYLIRVFYKRHPKVFTDLTEQKGLLVHQSSFFQIYHPKRRQQRCPNEH